MVGYYNPELVHELRRGRITLALDVGVALRDAQDYARHRDPRTTRRYDNPQELHQVGKNLQVAC